MPNSNSKITTFIIIAAVTIVTVAGDENNKNTTMATSITIDDVMNIILSIIVSTFSSIRTLLSQGTYIAFSPARLTYKTITWMMRRLILLITQLTLNPIVSFILVAIGCGLLIGGCAGFAVEAFSSMLLSATWGKQTKKLSTEVNEQEEEQEDPMVLSAELNNSDTLSYKRQAKFEEFSNNEFYEGENDLNNNEAVKDEKTDLMHEILKRHLEQVSQEQQQSNLRRRTPVVA